MAADEAFQRTRDKVTTALVNTTRTVAAIAAEDLSFQRSLNPAIADVLATQQARLLQVSQSLIDVTTVRTGVSAPRLSGVDAIENEWSTLVDVFDDLLEKTDACLDEYTGIIKTKDTPTVTPASSRGLSVYSRTSQNILKPQRLFRRKPDNNDKSPFKPLLNTKPHAIQPLEASVLPKISDDGRQSYPHPYQVEIEAYSFPKDMYSVAEPMPYVPFATSTATFVDTMDGVKAMLEELKAAKEIAIDLEHHDTYSFVGIVCLMQISTREKDWIVDTLKPWREDLEILNLVFANPNILKVFHGSSSDIVWLQRDLGLYVVGLFDTFHASRVLQHPQKSLKFLLERYVNFNAQKKFQMADWRTRPLPAPMFEYARSDTHFLLYLYDNLRNELDRMSASLPPDEHPLLEVLRSSKEESLQTYVRVIYDAERGAGPGGWANSLRSAPLLFSGEQFAVYKAIHEWRDQQARNDDTNPVMVMGRDVMFNIARALPESTQALLGSHQPFPTNIRPQADALLEIITTAKREGKSTPSLKAFLDSRVSSRAPTSRTGTRFPVPQVTDRLRQPANRTEVSVDKVPSAPSSDFWGKMLDDEHDAASITYSGSELHHRLLVPLPSFAHMSEGASASMSQVDRNGTQRPIDQLAASPIDGPQDQDHDEVFVVRDVARAKKRKVDQINTERDRKPRKDVNGEERSGNPIPGHLDGTLPDQIDHGSIQQLRDQRKHERKARTPGNGQATAPVEEDVPFDYTNAPTMMRAESTQAAQGHKRPMNPYIKSLDAPQGVRPVQRERPGKSLTFKE